MLYLLNDSEDQSFRLWIMTIISIMQIVYSSGMATYSVGASAKMWSPFFKNDGMFKMVTAEHWSHCRHFSVRVPYGWLPRLQTGKPALICGHLLSSRLLPPSPVPSKDKVINQVDETPEDLTVLGPWMLPKDGPANSLALVLLGVKQAKS